MNNLGKKISRFSKLMALAIGLTVLGASARADAIEVTPDFIEYFQGSILFGSPAVAVTNYMLIQVGGVNYLAGSAVGGTCSAQAKNLDTIKHWLSMAQAATLSGKKVVLNFTTCSGANFISTIMLKR